MNDIQLKELIHKTIYASADLNSSIPDVDQMISFLYKELSPSISFQEFTRGFLERMMNNTTLETCFFDGVIDFWKTFSKELRDQGKNILINSWTQGNLYLQTKKAQVFQAQLSSEVIAKPSIYASLEKITLLREVKKSLEDQGCDLLCLIDDRLENVIAAKKIINDENIVFIHKIRPDKVIKDRLEKQESNIWECVEWDNFKSRIMNCDFSKLGLILDKDGIIYNSTKYRKKT